MTRQWLTHWERDNAIALGQRKYAETCGWSTNPNLKAHYRPDGYRNGDETDYIKGAVAEYAFGVMLDYEHTFRAYDPSATDVLGYEIRGTFHENGHLITKPTDKRGLYVFGVVDREYRFVTFYGWRRHRETVINLGRLAACPTRYATPQDELWPLEMLPATAEYVLHRTATLLPAT